MIFLIFFFRFLIFFFFLEISSSFSIFFFWTILETSRIEIYTLTSHNNSQKAPQADGVDADHREVRARDKFSIWPVVLPLTSGHNLGPKKNNLKGC